MKQYLSIFLGLCFAISFMFISCTKDENDEVVAETFKVIKTTPEFDHKGGIITIEVEGNPEKINSDASWITLKKTNNKIVCNIAANDGYEARTGLIFISGCDGSIQKIPVTQLGIISKIEVYDTDFDYHGESKEFTWVTSEKFTIENLPEWLHYEVVDGKIIFTADPLELTSESRIINLDIKVGALYHKVIHFTQTIPEIPYELLLGKYKMSYSTWHGNDKKDIDIDLIAHKNGVSYELRGLGYPVIVLYDPKLPGIRINVQQFTPKGLSDKIILRAWSAYGNGWFSKNENLGVIGVIKDKKNISFDLVDNGGNTGEWVDDKKVPIVVWGFIVWGDKTKEYKGPNVISRIVDMHFEKIANK